MYVCYEVNNPPKPVSIPILNNDMMSFNLKVTLHIKMLYNEKKTESLGKYSSYYYECIQ
jgi:hypothetical protein